VVGIVDAAVIELLLPEAGPVPTLFVAVTLNVYEVPEVSPVTVIGEELLVPVIPPGLEVAVYCVIAVPPLSAGAEKVIDASLFVPAVAVPIVGAPGAVFGSGQLPPEDCWSNCVDVNKPLAEPVFPPLVVGRVLLTKPPNQRLDIS
jgi:hypothetical protein